MADLSMLAPSGGMKPPGKTGGLPGGMGQPPQKGAVGQNPGGIEALRKSVQVLQKMGMDAEEIIQVVLQMAERLGLDIGEEQLRPLVEQAAGGQPQGGLARGKPQGRPAGGKLAGGMAKPNLNLGV